MTATSHSTGALNEARTDLIVAWADVLEARRRLVHSPNTERIDDEHAAVRACDAALDHWARLR